MNRVINIRESYFTVGTIDPIDIHSIGISSDSIDSGRFGWIHDCSSINGKEPSLPLVIKLLKQQNGVREMPGYSTILRLQRRINTNLRRFSNRTGKTFLLYPGLTALPCYSFRGEEDKKEVYGYAMADLRAMGYCSMEKALNETGIERDKFKALSFLKKLQCCFHISKGFEMLSSLNYVHADINPKNLFINTERCEVALIDYDGGGILDTDRDDTLTHGNLQDGEWMAPEIYESIAENKPFKVDQYSDRWSVVIAFHYLLFDLDPFFFLNENSVKCKQAYLMNNPFYPVNQQDQNIREEAIYFIDDYEKKAKNEIPAAIHTELIKNFQDGFLVPQKRTDYSEWVKLFRQTQAKPTILFFKSDKIAVIKGSTIRLSWNVEGAIELEIDNQVGIVTGKTEITIQPSESVRFYLKATGHFGESEAFLDIAIFPTPIIEYLKIPTPEFITNISFPKIMIEAPKIDITICLEKEKFFPMPVFTPLKVELLNLKLLYKKGFSFRNISLIFKKLIKKNYDS